MFSINARFREVFEDSGLSQEKFAKRIKRSRGEVANIIYDKVIPRDEIIAAVCEEFRIREEWLRTGKGEKPIADTEREKLQRFFADVLATAPDERSAFISALADLPYDFWPLAAAMIQNYAKNYNYGAKKED
jgi:transcriptional regulator with XRE-family HTH domain